MEKGSGGEGRDGKVISEIICGGEGREYGRMRHAKIFIK